MAKVTGKGRGRSKPVQNLTQEVENVGEADQQLEEVDIQLPEPAVISSALSSSQVPGSRRTYQEIVTEYVRDFLVKNQTNYGDMMASKVV